MIERIKKIKNAVFSWLKTPSGKKLKRAMPGILLITLIFSIVLLTIFHSTDGFTTIVATENAHLVTEKSSMSFTGYMLRDEVTIGSDYSGGVYYLAEDAERVRPGGELARVYENSIDKSVENLIYELDRCIEILEESIGDGHFTLGDSKEVQSGISAAHLAMMQANSSGNASVVSSLADDFLILLNKMESYASNDTARLQQLLDEYKSERNKAESYYSGKNRTVVSEYGGYFFRETDGYEGIYTSSQIDTMTYDDFIEMTSKEKNTAHSIGKIVLNYKWYIAIPTVTGISDTFYVGGEYDMSFPDSGNRSFKMQLEKIIPDSVEAKSIMLFSCGTVDASFDYLRIQQVNVINKDITGYRVPATAVCEQGGNTGVYILTDGMASFRKIVILYQGDNYYIVSSENTNSDDYYVYLELNDRIITDCKNMYNGKVIE